MFIALFIVAVYHLCTQAAPVAPPGGASEAATECQQFRTIWSIIWSCLFTLFACTWTAVHPNLPGPNDGALTVLWTKIKLVLLALIAPEYVLFWALEQRRKAKVVADLAKESKDPQLSQWTLSHGFLATMGGFVLENESCEPVHAVVPGQSDMEFEHFHFPRITEQQIQDRSKSDAFSKLIAIVQLAWFLTQCIARGVERLAVTELELVTTAYTLITLLTYIAWWHKPMGMRCYVPVTYVEGKESVSFQFDVEDEASGLTDKLGRFVFQVAGLRSGQIKVPTLFSGGSYPGGDHQDRTLCQEYAVGVLFGAVHCIGWNFEFLSRAEQLLWRISSVGITAYPAIGLVLFLTTLMTGMEVNDLLLAWAMPLGVCTFIFGPPLYLLFRLVLLVLPFVALRQLPESAYQNVRWTTFIPHIG